MSCGALTFSIFCIISFNFISRITHFSSRTHFSLRWHLYFFPPERQETHFFSTIHLEPGWWWCWTGHLGLTPAEQSQLLVTVWEPFISLFVIGGLSVVVAILWLFTRPNMAPRSLNMEQINFFSSGHLCGGKTVIQLKVINLQSCVVNGRGLGLTDRTEDR